MKRKFYLTAGRSLVFGGLLLLSAAMLSCKSQSKVDDASSSYLSGDTESIFTTEATENLFKSVHPPLNGFLQRRRAALELLGGIPSEQLKSVTLRARTTAEQRAGVRRIRFRGHQIISDSDYTFAGYSLGPGSPESALTVIASDIADTYISQAALKGVRIDSLGVSIASRPDSVPPAVRVVYPHNLLYTIYVKSPASDAQLEELRLLTEQHSPVFNLVSTGQVISGDIDYKQTPKDLTAKPPYQPGLREYLKYKRAALLWRQNRGGGDSRADNSSDTARAGRQRAARPQLDRLHVEVDPASGARRLHIRHFNLLHDNPAYLAGSDLGPSAHEHQLGVLTSCITHITEIQAASREIVLDSLSISIEGTLDPRAGRPGFEDVPPYLHNIRYTVHVRSPHTYEEIVALRDAVEAVCPIYNLILSEQKIEGRIVRDNPDNYRVHPQYHYHYRD
ncbi:MAG: OsmC family protein [Prevotellaceae bacterium]|jgi:uncharacterized OsmC-like protein|nr:OsmC family protein [Prevotellaceae bacterium]